MKALGQNASDIRKSNRGKVIELIATGRCRTRKELVSMMGLTKMAISNMVTEFQNKKLLVEEEKEPAGHVGRRSVNIAISEDAPKAIGLLLIRDRVEVVLCDFYLNILYREKVMLHKPTERELVQIIFRLVENALQRDKNVLGIGVSCLGPVNSELGIIMTPPYFYGISELAVESLLEAKFSLPVRVQQDNESGALEEYLYGNGKGHENMMLVGLERGVGCGIVKDGRINSGLHRRSPAIGHISIDYKGRRCVCGNRGCVEMYVNTPEVLRRFEKVLGPGKSLEEYYQMQTSPEMLEILEDVLDKLSAGISSTINLLNLDLVILGYDGAVIPDNHLNYLERKINERIFYSDKMKVKVKRPYYAKDAQLLGGACNILRAVFDGDLLVD